MPRISRTFTIEASADRIVLFSWSADAALLRRNVARIDRQGEIIWRAELPGKAFRDAFTRLDRDGDGFIAHTYSEWAVRVSVEGVTESVERAFARCSPSGL